jgi:hypothetical protein
MIQRMPPSDQLRRADRPIVASRQMAEPAEEVARFLADLENHVRLAPGSVQVLSLDRRPGLGDRALVRLRGPLAVRRTAWTEVVEAPAANSIVGRACIGCSTVASVNWTIRRQGAGSDVTLCATVDAASRLDGLLLRFGGRRWLARRFAAALDQLAHVVSSATAQSRSGTPTKGAPVARTA